MSWPSTAFTCEMGRAARSPFTRYRHHTGGRNRRRPAHRRARVVRIFGAHGLSVEPDGVGEGHPLAVDEPALCAYYAAAAGKPTLRLVVSHSPTAKHAADDEQPVAEVGGVNGPHSSLDPHGSDGQKSCKDVHGANLARQLGVGSCAVRRAILEARPT